MFCFVFFTFESQVLLRFWDLSMMTRLSLKMILLWKKASQNPAQLCSWNVVKLWPEKLGDRKQRVHRLMSSIRLIGHWPQIWFIKCNSLQRTCFLLMGLKSSFLLPALRHRIHFNLDSVEECKQSTDGHWHVGVGLVQMFSAAAWLAAAFVSRHLKRRVSLVFY